MATSTQDFKTLYTTMVAQVQAAAGRVISGTVGSLVQALMQACAAQVVWLQGLVLQLLATTRAATSTGTDLDSWMNDYGITRFAAVPAIWNASFSRLSATEAAFLYPTQTTNADGSISYTAAVQTQDGTQQYAITIDTTHTAWVASSDDSGGAGYYLLNPGQQAVTDIPLLALVAGAAGGASGSGVQALQINTLVQAMPGIDTVSNTGLRQPGADAEADDALRLRFQEHIASLSRATLTAVTSAVAGVAANASCIIVENEDVSGNERDGYFYVVVDDGSGNPDLSPTFLGTITSAIDAVRPLTVNFNVYGPTPLVTTVSLSVTVAEGYDPVQTRNAVQAAISAYISAQGLGQGLFFTRLVQVAYDASPGVLDVSGLSLNGGTGNIAAGDRQRLIPWYYTVGQAAVDVGGSDYVVGDVLTVQGGTFTTAATLTVDAVDGSGAVTALTVATTGIYSAMPSGTAAVSGGSGSGLTLVLSPTTVSTITVS